MNKIIVNCGNKNVYKEQFTSEEIAALEDQKTIQEFEQSLQPSQDDLERAEFELKTIEILITLGVI